MMAADVAVFADLQLFDLEQTFERGKIGEIAALQADLFESGKKAQRFDVAEWPVTGRMAAETGHPFAFAMQMFDLVALEHRPIGGIEFARFQGLHEFVERHGPIAEWPVLLHTRALNQALNGEKLVAAPLGIDDPGFSALSRSTMMDLLPTHNSNRVTA